jgi:hypothetical protein
MDRVIITVAGIMVKETVLYTVSKKDCTLFLFFFLGAQCVESGVSCTDFY